MHCYRSHTAIIITLCHTVAHVYIGMCISIHSASVFQGVYLYMWMYVVPGEDWRADIAHAIEGSFALIFVLVHSFHFSPPEFATSSLFFSDAYMYSLYVYIYMCGLGRGLMPGD